jgi:hypothetical protein
VRHLTKDSGDKGVACVIADLMLADIHICLPISEHLPFDMVAMSPDGRLSKVQVKYRSLVNGKVSVSTQRTVWSNSRGMHSKARDLSEFDAFAIYCPEVKTVYYVRCSEVISCERGFVLRISPSKNNQVSRIRSADDYRDPMIIFTDL